VAALEIDHGHSPTSPFVTISGGIAMSAAGGQTGPEDLLATADKLLFRAKSLGRNRIVSADVMLLAESLERGAA
jgi:PleD family two-component response regulator